MDGNTSSQIQDGRNQTYCSNNIKNYKLNEELAMKKKLASTERDDIEIQHTNGGLRIFLNAGAYELLKEAVDAYYIESYEKTHRKIPVHDQNGSLVETRYKIAMGKKHFYTLNMYHTKCSCLINGKKTDVFIKTDLPNILRSIQYALKLNDLSVTDVNENVKNWISRYFESSTRDCNKCASDDVDLEPRAIPPESKHSPCPCPVDRDVINTIQNKDLSIETNQSQSPCHTHSDIHNEINITDLPTESHQSPSPRPVYCDVRNEIQNINLSTESLQSSSSHHGNCAVNDEIQTIDLSTESMPCQSPCLVYCDSNHEIQNKDLQTEAMQSQFPCHVHDDVNNETPFKDLSSESKEYRSSSPLYCDVNNEIHYSNLSNEIAKDSTHNLILKICHSVQELREDLQSHINFSANQFGRISDEIQSIKNKITVECKSIERQVDSVEESTESVHARVRSANNEIQRKLQSMFDVLKLKIETLSTNAIHEQANQDQDQKRQTSESTDVSDISSSDPIALNRQEHHQTNNSTSRQPDHITEPIISSQMGAPQQTATSETSRRSARQKFLTLSSGHEVEYFDIAKTLIIGDSVLKGVRTRGLETDVEVYTLPGKKTIDVCRRLRSWDMSTCETVVMYIGGNDAACGTAITDMEKELNETLDQLNNGNRCVYICSLCPRSDVDISSVNTMLRKVCSKSYAKYLDINQSFIYEDGHTRLYLYHADGIHLNWRGSSTLVRTIDRTVPIVRNTPQRSSRSDTRDRYSDRHANIRRPTWRSPQQKCENCGLSNHATFECRRPLQQTASSKHDRSGRAHRWLMNNRRDSPYSRSYQTTSSYMK